MNTKATAALVGVALASLGCGTDGTPGRRAGDATGSDATAGGAVTVNMSEYPAGAVYDAAHHVVWLANGDREDCEPAWSTSWSRPKAGDPYLWHDKCAHYLCGSAPPNGDWVATELKPCTTDADCKAGDMCEWWNYFEW